jgi:hypothetical protein
MPMWQRSISTPPHIPINPRRKMMKALYALALAGFVGLAASVAHADEAAVAQSRNAKAATTTSAAAPATPVKISQQDKMRLCAKQATGKKGAERKTFMKGCLSKKA